MLNDNLLIIPSKILHKNIEVDDIPSSIYEFFIGIYCRLPQFLNGYVWYLCPNFCDIFIPVPANGLFLNIYWELYVNFH